MHDSLRMRNHSLTSQTSAGANAVQKDLQPEELGFGTVFDSIRDGVVVADMETQRIALWNPGATRIFGYSSSEAQELKVEALVPEHLKARYRAGVARYAKTDYGPYIDSQEVLNLPAVRKDGREVNIELTLSPITPVYEADGEGDRFVLAIIRDTTERRQAEEAIRCLNEILEKRVAERTAALAKHERELKELVGKLVAAQVEEGEESPEVASASTAGRPFKKPPGPPPPPELSKRELAVLRLLMQGQTNHEIARNLLISTSTVKKHVRHIIEKLGVSERIQAAVRAAELDLLSEDESE